MTLQLSRHSGGLKTAPAPAATRPLCFGHRGARGHAPENTLLAFDLAFDLGAEGIECDAQLSADGRVVIIHDSTVNRTTNGRGAVSKITFEALRALEAGQGIRSPQRIPTLEETLALVLRRGGLLNLELKADTDAEAIAVAEAVASTLDALPPDNSQRASLLFSSFNLPAVARIRELAPWARVAALYGGRKWTGAAMIEAALQLGVEAIHPHPRILTEEIVRLAHEAGLQVNVWTANRLGVIRQLIAWGVDGLFSDYPERVVIARRLAAMPLDQG